MLIFSGRYPVSVQGHITLIQLGNIEWEQQKKIRGEIGKSENKSLTHDPDKEFRLILSSRVSHGDGVVALIVFLCPLDYKAAQGLPRLHTDPSFGLSHHLPHRAGQSEGDRQNKGGS